MSIYTPKFLLLYYVSEMYKTDLPKTNILAPITLCEKSLFVLYASYFPKSNNVE